MGKIGLCLAGGGARGAYQIGAVKALEELGYFQKVSAFSGTSIGAVNVSILACKTPDEAKNLWLSIAPKTLKSSESLFKRLIKEKTSFMANGMYEMDQLYDILKANLNTRRLKKKEVYVTLSEAGEVNEGVFGLLKNSYRHFVKKNSMVIYSPLKSLKKDDIYKHILASCSIPIVFPSLKMENKQYYDGGVYDNVPVRPLIDGGCDCIIVIQLHKLTFFDPKKYEGIRFIEIKHHGSLGGILNFDPQQAKSTFDLGYQDVYEYFKSNEFFS